MKRKTLNSNDQESTFAYHTIINGTDYFVRILSANKATKSYEDLIKKRLLHAAENGTIHDNSDDESADV